MAQILASRRGRILADNGYRYQLNKRRTNTIYWRCTKLNCRSKLSTNVFDVNDPNANIVVVNNAAAHNHLPEDEQVQHDQVRNRMQERIRADPTVPVRRIYDAVVVEQHQAAAAVAAPGVGQQPDVPRFDSIRSTLNRTRTALLPPVPDDLRQVVSVLLNLSKNTRLPTICFISLKRHKS